MCPGSAVLHFYLATHRNEKTVRLWGGILLHCIYSTGLGSYQILTILTNALLNKRANLLCNNSNIVIVIFMYSLRIMIRVFQEKKEKESQVHFNAASVTMYHGLQRDLSFFLRPLMNITWQKSSGYQFLCIAKRIVPVIIFFSSSTRDLVWEALGRVILLALENRGSHQLPFYLTKRNLLRISFLKWENCHPNFSHHAH